MQKILLFPVLMLFACGLAALYGAVHNQISYTVAPVYFHELKFDQFAIDPALHNRIGAALVGVQASWWMGMIIGLPIYVLGLFVKGPKTMALAFIRVAVIVVLITLGIGLAALLYAEISFAESSLPSWMPVWNASDPVAFAKAAVMHEFGYIGGFVGLLCGIVLMIRYARKSR